MVEAWEAHKWIMIIFFGAIAMGILIGLWWGSHSIKAPFRERRLTRRTIWQRIRWRLQHGMKPATSHH